MNIRNGFIPILKRPTFPPNAASGVRDIATIGLEIDGTLPGRYRPKKPV